LYPGASRSSAQTLAWGLYYASGRGRPLSLAGGLYSASGRNGLPIPGERDTGAGFVQPWIVLPRHQVSNSRLGRKPIAYSEGLVGKRFMVQVGRKKRGRRRARTNRNVGLVSHLPPMYNNMPVFRRTFRYNATVTAPGNVIIQSNQLITSLVTCPASSTNLTFYSVFSGYRLTKISIFDRLGGDVGVKWRGSIYAKDEEKRMEGSSAYPSHIAMAPPKLTSASFWNDSSGIFGNTSQAIFELSWGQGSAVSVTRQLVVDISLEFMLANSTNGMFTYTAVTPSATVAGIIYTPYLDTSNLLIPDGRVNALKR